MLTNGQSQMKEYRGWIQEKNLEFGKMREYAMQAYHTVLWLDSPRLPLFPSCVGVVPSLFWFSKINFIMSNKTNFLTDSRADSDTAHRGYRPEVGGSSPRYDWMEHHFE